MYSTSGLAKDCAIACGNFDSCSLIGVIEIEKKSDELYRAYSAKVLSVKYFPEKYVLTHDGFDEEGQFINSVTVKDIPPKEIILVEDGIKKIKELREIKVVSHSSDMFYDVGSKYYFFGRKIKDNIYETSRASCTVEIK